MFLLLQVQETSLQQLTQVPKISHFHYTKVLAIRIILLIVSPVPFSVSYTHLTLPTNREV